MSAKNDSNYIVQDPYTMQKYAVKIERITAHLNNRQGCNYDNTELSSTAEALSWANNRKGTLTIRRFFEGGMEEETFSKRRGERFFTSNGAEAQWY